MSSRLVAGPTYSDCQTKSQTYLFTKTYLELLLISGEEKDHHANQADVGLIIRAGRAVRSVLVFIRTMKIDVSLTDV